MIVAEIPFDFDSTYDRNSYLKDLNNENQREKLDRLKSLVIKNLDLMTVQAELITEKKDEISTLKLENASFSSELEKLGYFLEHVNTGENRGKRGKEDKKRLSKSDKKEILENKRFSRRKIDKGKPFNKNKAKIGNNGEEKRNTPLKATGFGKNKLNVTSVGNVGSKIEQNDLSIVNNVKEVVFKDRFENTIVPSNGAQTPYKLRERRKGNVSKSLDDTTLISTRPNDDAALNDDAMSCSTEDTNYSESLWEFETPKAKKIRRKSSEVPDKTVEPEPKFLTTDEPYYTYLGSYVPQLQDPFSWHQGIQCPKFRTRVEEKPAPIPPKMPVMKAKKKQLVVKLQDKFNIYRRRKIYGNAYSKLTMRRKMKKARISRSREEIAARKVKKAAIELKREMAIYELEEQEKRQKKRYIRRIRELAHIQFLREKSKDKNAEESTYNNIKGASPEEKRSFSTFTFLPELSSLEGIRISDTISVNMLCQPIRASDDFWDKAYTTPWKQKRVKVEGNGADV